MSREIFLLLVGMAAGSGATLWVCNALSWFDHREWCKIVDKQHAIIETLIEAK